MLIPILTLQPCLALQNWKRNRTKNLESFCRMIEEDICCLRINWKQRRTWSESLDPSSERWLQRSTRGATPWQDHIKGPRGQQCLWLQSLDFDRKSTPEAQTMILRRPRRRRRTIVVLLAVSGAGLLLLLWTGGEEEERQEKDIPCSDGGQVGSQLTILTETVVLIQLCRAFLTYPARI